MYHSYFKPLEWTIPHKGDNACYAKLICNMEDKLVVPEFDSATRARPPPRHCATRVRTRLALTGAFLSISASAWSVCTFAGLMLAR